MGTFILIAIVLGLLALWIAAGFFLVHPREEIVCLSFGKLAGLHRREGINWRQPIGRSNISVSTQDVTFDITSSTVVDLDGKPINISAVVVYRIVDTVRAALEVDNAHKFIVDQAGAIVKRVCSNYPYDNVEGDAPCLRLENPEVTDALIDGLQEAVSPAGVRVLSVRFNDLSYAPEIAQAMLMRQQALAFIDARKTIVEGSVQLIKDAADQLKENGFDMSQEQVNQLASSLLVVLSSGDHAQPVLQVQSHRGGGQ